MQKHTLWFNTLSMNDVNQVGGKNASLGEMVSNLSNAGVSVPNGFATTSHAFHEFLEYEGLNNRIYDLLGTLDVNDVDALRETGSTIRNWILDAPFPLELEQSIRRDYLELIDGNQALSVAVSFISATAGGLTLMLPFAGATRNIS
ncbi:PEP/pyruvate-binding domain-containing protein [Photobacterium leiognathi]|uniref:PEP/pyruvate-binding domain-containing protein n=1 Tax=Photobacterium leiognathi TaxID=553611 RepID=UPI00273475FF|nr:PEP/pyruvate-binding domain-containing protein [Photobacterium leiognathi]